MQANELRRLREQTQTACGANPAGQDCSDLSQRHRDVLARYDKMLADVPSGCRARLPDPASL